MKSETARVFLVGAGPGEPDLLTLRARDILARADCVLYDSLLNPAILEYAPSHCERIHVGKRLGQHSMPQDAIHTLILKHAQQGQTIVRLKGGDPFIFGRGGEEIEFLAGHGIATEVVPGVTSASAASASLRIPLTHRTLGPAVIFLSGYSKAGAGDADGFPGHDWQFLARSGYTLVIYMGLHHLVRIARVLLQQGRAGETPVAIISKCTLPDERVLIQPLAEFSTPDISERIADIAFPAISIIGDVLSLLPVRQEL